MTKPKHNIRVKRAQDPSSKGTARSVGACAFYSSAVRKATPYASPEISVTRPGTPWDGGEGKSPHKVTETTKRKPPLWPAWQCPWEGWDTGWKVLGAFERGSDGSTGPDFGVRNQTLVHAGMAMTAEIAGSNPSSGTAKYYFRDHLGSTRRVHAADKSTLATTEYQPYGDTYATSGTQPRFTFTGKPWDASAAMYYFPYRFYSPSMARWISRDPLGIKDGVNQYWYAKDRPIDRFDIDGRIVPVVLCAYGFLAGVVLSLTPYLFRGHLDCYAICNAVVDGVLGCVLSIVPWASYGGRVVKYFRLLESRLAWIPGGHYVGMMAGDITGYWYGLDVSTRVGATTGGVIGGGGLGAAACHYICH